MSGPTPPAPVHTAALFRPLHEELIALLRGLPPAAWDAPTVAGRWCVRDVVAHLLDTELRRIAADRDGHVLPPDREIGGYEDLVAFLNRLNADWVTAARRLSPALLVELLEFTGPRAAAAYESLDPNAPARFGVAWAGEESSPSWFDVGREYTERWHHQAQIRDAVGAPELLGRRFYRPFLEISMRALPRALEKQAAPEGASVVVTVDGEGGGLWSVRRGNAAWHLLEGEAAPAAARVGLAPPDAWRVLYNALPPEEARRRARVEGDERLAGAILRTRSVMV